MTRKNPSQAEKEYRERMRASGKVAIRRWVSGHWLEWYRRVSDELRRADEYGVEPDIPPPYRTDPK